VIVWPNSDLEDFLETQTRISTSAGLLITSKVVFSVSAGYIRLLYGTFDYSMGQAVPFYRFQHYSRKRGYALTIVVNSTAGYDEVNPDFQKLNEALKAMPAVSWVRWSLLRRSPHKTWPRSLP
jgi:hypothetical protein